MQHDTTHTFEHLNVWQQARLFINAVYRITKIFPQEERFGLCSQFQRAAISIAANIAEGYKRKGKSEKLRFFNISQGSLEECRCYIILSQDLGYISDTQYQELLNALESTSRMLNAYCSKIIEENVF